MCIANTRTTSVCIVSGIMASLGFLQNYLPEPFKSIPTHMDYLGQQKAERIFQVIITLCAIVGFIWGYVEQRFSYTVYITLGGFFVSCLIVLIPWPMFRVKKDLVWQKVLEEKEGKGDTSTQKEKKN
ncbi:signal peptidase complex subunit 1-like [Watersipora subatra]|uniref:signal peptidase complex subunit 1-like n=1 Tax=Watersipora subatra TaxID=2589382 RepID=UPI00355BF298